MLARTVAAMSIAGLPLLLVPAPAAAQDGGWSTPRTPWGHPDLQGIWSNTTTTPMERPEDLAGREFLTEEERVARNPGSGISAEERTAFMPTGAVNDYWLEKGELLLQTSLIVDPPDGRYPPLTPEAQARLARRRASYTGGELASWEDFSTYDRCLTRGMPGAMTPGWYNHNYLILQTPTHVVILVEMIHDARIVRLDGSPADGVEQWLGQSTGRWEGDTLVVETTHLEEPQRRVVERLTRTGADSIDYEVTVRDDGEWTGPWTALMPMSAIEGPLFEYACHEGNYGLPNMLSGKRAEEAEAR
ncbi:MAG: hypothetical protein F4057_01755 [Acidobacteria bacterium]|nr:hypothetical protein [Acidobacteriota bacterium]